jgi:hypothetical protein
MVGRVWGVTELERAESYPCDGLLDRVDEVLYRGVSVRAPAPVVYRWLCQLRVAPYSYDWIDNFGRQSPRRLIPGLEQLALGQRVMGIFTLVGFVPDREITLEIVPASTAERAFGQVVGTYRVVDRGPECRLLVKLCVRYGRGPWGALMARVLPLGDLIMMRRQLLRLKALAEASVAGPRGASRRARFAGA